MIARRMFELCHSLLNRKGRKHFGTISEKETRMPDRKMFLLRKKMTVAGAMTKAQGYKE
jgi:hypothetical protein